MLRSRAQEPPKNRWQNVAEGARKKLSECTGTRTSHADLYRCVMATVLIEEEGIFRDIVTYL